MSLAADADASEEGNGTMIAGVVIGVVALLGCGFYVKNKKA
jgi:hypothetical protein